MHQGAPECGQEEGSESGAGYAGNRPTSAWGAVESVGGAEALQGCAAAACPGGGSESVVSSPVRPACSRSSRTGSRFAKDGHATGSAPSAKLIADRKSDTRRWARWGFQLS